MTQQSSRSGVWESGLRHDICAALSVAVDVRTIVFPYPLADTDADAYAAQHRAVLAVRRASAGANQESLSLASLRSGAAPARVVLPLPNGSTIAHRVGSRVPVLIAACLRNALAVGTWIAQSYPEATVAVIVAGERWDDGSLRPAAEDMWDTGAVIEALVANGAGGTRVAAVMGPPGSGRSTLLDLLVGRGFAITARLCTRKPAVRPWQRSAPSLARSVSPRR